MLSVLLDVVAGCFRGCDAAVGVTMAALFSTFSFCSFSIFFSFIRE